MQISDSLEIRDLIDILCWLSLTYLWYWLYRKIRTGSTASDQNNQKITTDFARWKARWYSRCVRAQRWGAACLRLQKWCCEVAACLEQRSHCCFQRGLFRLEYFSCARNPGRCWRFAGRLGGGWKRRRAGDACMSGEETSGEISNCSEIRFGSHTCCML